MGLMASLKSLFGGDSVGTATDAVDYLGYSIQPEPQQREGGWNTAGTISKTVDGEVKLHRFIRVDTHSSRDEAISFSVIKAQQIIDEQGDHLFKSR